LDIVLPNQAEGRMMKIMDGGPFAQKLGVEGDAKILAGPASEALSRMGMTRSSVLPGSMVLRRTTT